MTGRIIVYKNYEVAPSIISLPIGYLTYGMYFYEIRNKVSVIRDRFIKE
jgi:hypothetical protein